MKNMRWFIGMFVILFFMRAQAADVFISVKADSRRNHCAFFKGSFNKDNIASVQNKWKPWVACSLTEGVGAECWLKDHGMDGVLPDPAKFVGNFRWSSGQFVILATALRNEVFNIRLICNDEGTGCEILHFWNADAGIGYGCDMVPYTPPISKPEPKAPPLLRKDTPAYKVEKSNPLSF
jgi:hypothetical protein